ncbi:MAG: class I SAM-dependent methyltransferase [Hyphomicrobiaceae bacterium]|nr:class I SAM-dependent methyltransferase [Hyphomicrobiaceae bacterium]
MDRIGRATQFAGNYLRFGWYSGIGWLAAREGRRIAPPARVTRQRPVPSEQEMLADLAHLFRKDAALVGDGLAAASASDPAGGLSDHFQRLGAMMRDVPDAVRRRQDRDAGTVAPLAEQEGVPDYFAQDFHFQKGGYLADDSARLYDVQVETLFYGSAAAMRRAALRPIGEHLARRDQRGVHLLDVACGTGRLLREIRLVYPAMSLTGLDLSPAYLAEARRHMGNLRPATLVRANAEAMPLADASQNIVTTSFLFHELPADVRRRVAAEMARVLKPGGTLVFIDSLQIGDRPGWDGLLEGFPQRFHEPYYRHYTIDDLDAVFNGVGLQAVGWSPAFLSKVMVRRKG